MAALTLQLYTQPFCAPCVRARSVVHRAAQLVPDLVVEEINVIDNLETSRDLGISSTPVIRLLRGGRELFRGVQPPTLNQLLTAIAEHHH